MHEDARAYPRAMGFPHAAIRSILLAGSCALSSARAEDAFAGEIRPLLEAHCVSCHSAEKQKGDLDLERFATGGMAQAEPRLWQEVIAQIEDGAMPPEDEPQPSAEEKERLLAGLRAMLHKAALAQAGDPGPVVLRRLSNAEYTWTLRDLTGVNSLDPAREFPVDGAAGEGFTNAGAALVMSPALVRKYLDAAKEVAAHAVLLPDGIAFSPSTSGRDWTEETLAEIRSRYDRWTVPGEGMPLDLQGIRFETLDGGALPLDRYFGATLHDADALAAGKFDEVATARDLSPKYLRLLWEMLHRAAAGYPLAGIQELWRGAGPGDEARLTAAVKGWQRSLWRFHPIGQIGKRGGPASWQEAVTPVAEKRELRLKLPADPAGPVTVRLSAKDARDGAEGDAIRWENVRLVRGKWPPLPLQEATAFEGRLQALLSRETARTAEYLAALSGGDRSGLDEDLLGRWAALTGIGGDVMPEVRGLFTNRISALGGNGKVRGWGRPETPSMAVNGSAHTEVFGTVTMPSRSLIVHPSPEREAVVSWRSPVAGKVRVSGEVADADGTCGNGIAWRVEVTRRTGRTDLAVGVLENGGREGFAPDTVIGVETGDLIAVAVMPLDRHHACDSTRVSLSIREAGGDSWDLAEVIDRIHDGNPLADAKGRPGVWNFGSHRSRLPLSSLPGDSLLVAWRDAVVENSPQDRIDHLATRVCRWLADGTADMAPQDRELRERLRAPDGPLGWAELALRGIGTTEPATATVPSELTYEVPAWLAAGAEVVVTARIASEDGSVVADLAASDARGHRGAAGEMPVLAAGSGADRARAGFAAFHGIFPAAVCYTKIVPVDEVVTLRLFYREDELLRRLVLDDAQASEMERLWKRLDFVSDAPLRLVDAYEQLFQYATQGGNASEMEPLRRPVMEWAEKYRAELVAAEPTQLAAVIDLAAKAWRRPLAGSERESLEGLYRKIRAEEIPHDEALRLTLARVLTAPAFLYKMEQPSDGKESLPLSDYELAVRLSYFLWSSGPDPRLEELAAAGKLSDPEVLAEEARRMTRDPRVRRLAIEFAAQWLHVKGVDQLDEKSEAVFPEFAGIRADLNEEPVRFFTDLFQSDGSLMDLIDADHVFVNGRLAEYYGIRSVEGDGWRKVTGARQHGRGGILGFGAALAKQSGASRTSPVLRGTWVCETLLGEHLPPPPKDVPPLPEQPPGGLSERELTELHAKEPACARCHVRIDPFGFALEHYDAIGRRRENDLTGRPVNATAVAPGGSELTGIDGLRAYLSGERREDFVRQFCRKLLGYALGRGVIPGDEPLLDEMQRALSENEYRVGSAIACVVRSRQFREIRGLNHPEEISPTHSDQ